MLDYEALGDILAWGMVDKFSWLQGFAPRDDKLEVRCCPYDLRIPRQAAACGDRGEASRPPGSLELARGEGTAREAGVGGSG